MVYVLDLARALELLASTPGIEGRAYFANHPEIVSTRDFVRRIGTLMGRDVRIIPIPKPRGASAARRRGQIAAITGNRTILRADKAHDFFCPAWTGDPTHLMADTGWQPEYDLARGLPATKALVRGIGMAVGASAAGQTRPWRLVEIVLATYSALVSLTALSQDRPVALEPGYCAGACPRRPADVDADATADWAGSGSVLREVSPLVLILVGYSALDVLSGGGLFAVTTTRSCGGNRPCSACSPRGTGGEPLRVPFWSFLLHGVYLFYYLVLAVPSLFFIARGDWPALRLFSRNVVCTYCFCFLIFAWFPVGGPYYVFARPTGPSWTTCRRTWCTPRCSAAVRTARPSRRRMSRRPPRPVRDVEGQSGRSACSCWCR